MLNRRHSLLPPNSILKINFISLKENDNNMADRNNEREITVVWNILKRIKTYNFYFERIWKILDIF